MFGVDNVDGDKYLQRLKDYLEVTAAIAVLGGAVFIGWSLGRTDKTAPLTQVNEQATAESGINQTIRSVRVAALYGKCESNDVSTGEAWSQSTPSIIYRDFNDDKVEEAFVYAKIPGSESYSRGCVLSIDSNKALQILWRLDDVSLLYYSDFTVSDSTIEYTGKSDASAKQSTKVTYKWSNDSHTLLSN